MAVMSPFGAAPASSKRGLIKSSLRRVDWEKKEKGGEARRRAPKGKVGSMHLQSIALAPRKDGGTICRAHGSLGSLRKPWYQASGTTLPLASRQLSHSRTPPYLSKSSPSSCVLREGVPLDFELSLYVFFILHLYLALSWEA